MATVDNIRNSIIEKLLTISNKDLLNSLYSFVEKNTTDTDVVKLTVEQKIMLELSNNDIKSNRLISQEQLDKDDLKWLKEL